MRKFAVGLASAAALWAGPAHADTAVLAGGCFWGMETVFEHVKGVTNVVSGYAGGSARDANYDRVSSEGTSHAEAVKISYDPRQISYAQLLQVFFTVAHDPTQVNRQGPDSGPSYRSAIFPGGRGPGASRPRVHRPAQRQPRLQGADRDENRAWRLLSRRSLSPGFRAAAPLLSVHPRQRPPQGQRAAAEIPRALQGVRAAKQLKFHALFSLGRQSAGYRTIWRARGRRWRMGT